MSASEALSHAWFKRSLHGSQTFQKEMNDQQKLMVWLFKFPANVTKLRESINKMIDTKRENPENLKKQRRIMRLVPARSAPLWQRRMLHQPR